MVVVSSAFVVVSEDVEPVVVVSVLPVVVSVVVLSVVTEGFPCPHAQRTSASIVTASTSASIFFIMKFPFL